MHDILEQESRALKQGSMSLEQGSTAAFMLLYLHCE